VGGRGGGIKESLCIHQLVCRLEGKVLWNGSGGFQDPGVILVSP
jgi:hypothetical protein